MKHRAFILLLATSVLASPAFAAPVFMLQFGSYETRAEADSKLAELTAKHTGVIGGLNSGIRELNLPPDNLTVYRTQAGPLATRGEAQSICSQLASNGDECYVVETAMVAPMSPASTQMAQTTPESQPAPRLTPMADAKAPPASMETTAMKSPAAATTAPMAMAKANLPAAGTPPVAPPPAPASKLAPQAAPSVNVNPVPTRDPSSLAMINSVTSSPGRSMSAPVPETIRSDTPATPSPIVESAPMAAVAPAPSPSLQKALDEAAAEQRQTLAAAPTASGANQETGFWSRLNPFADEKPAPGVATVPSANASNMASKEPAPVATREIPAPRLTPMADAKAPPAPPPPVTVNVPPVKPAPVAAAVPAPTTPQPMAVPAPVTPPVATMEPATPMPMAAAPAPAPQPVTRVITQAEPLPLPPPPAPLIGKGAIATTPGDATAASLRAPAPTNPPQPTGNIPTPLVVPPPAASMAATGPGNVRVGEAQRVPLSQPMTPSPAPAMAPPPAPTMNAMLPQSPSATLGQKTLWAGIGPFPDAQAALGYWEQYRSTHPDFPVVRVRVTSNYQALQRGQEQVTLRVGPVQKPEAITNLCKTLPETPKLQCGRIADMGIAAQVMGRRPGFLPGSRYQR